MKKPLLILNIVALVATIIVNYLSNTGYFNGETMSSVSGRYENIFTPAGYAFSIWGLIYLSLLAFLIYQARLSSRGQQNDINAIGAWFIISCIANAAWVMAWLYDQIGLSVLLMIILFLSLAQIVVRLNIATQNAPLPRSLLVYLPFSIYIGWISVALIANIAAWLTKISWNGWGISESSWAVIMIIIAGLVNLFVLWKRNMGMFALTGGWALVAIAVANWDNASTVATVAIATAVVLILSVLIHALTGRKKQLAAVS